MTLLITGSSGLIGTALCHALSGSGHAVVRLLRTKPAPGISTWNPDEETIDLSSAGPIDAVIHLAGHSIAGGRWTRRNREAILNSRVKGTRLLVETLRTLTPPPRVLVSASAIGFYGDCGAVPVDESTGPGHTFLADVCQQWEQATAPAAAAGIRVVSIRLGPVLSASGGALPRMLPVFKLGLGGIIGHGAQYFSWVSLDDVVAMIVHILVTESLNGPVNLVSPQAVTNREFTRTLSRMLHRPAVFPLPAFAARLLFGKMADELVLQSSWVRPRKLEASGYGFRHPNLSQALTPLLTP